jgi:hypothetical protein
MYQKRRRKQLFILSTIVLLMSLACGSFRFGVVTPPSNEVDQPTSAAQPVKAEDTSASKAEIQTEEPTAEPPIERPESPNSIMVTAWLGHIASLPQGSQFDDFVILSPEGTGEFGLIGANAEIEAEILSLRDAQGAHEFVHLWGALACLGQDYNNCQLVVDRLQYGANFSEEQVTDWVGTIKSHTFNGGASYVFVLSGNYPIWYSIRSSQDQALQAQIETLADSGSMVRVSGQLLVGVPDVNGTRIEASQLELLELGTEEPGGGPGQAFDPTSDWPVFVNDRYSYQIMHPREASISLYGPVSFSADELPEGMSADQYLDQLLKAYTDRLCVQIEYSLGTIYISAPANQEKHLTPCGPTGVGSGEIVNKIENVYVGEQLYQANGMEIKLQVDDGSGGVLMGDTLNLHYELFSVVLADGTRITYGAVPHSDATYDDYLMKTKVTLLQILSTYQSLP